MRRKVRCAKCHRRLRVQRDGTVPVHYLVTWLLFPGVPDPCSGSGTVVPL